MIGEIISHYEILEHLGGGAMGVVYRAEDTNLRRQVALKFLPADLTDDPDATARFLREARAASALDHPNICPVYEIDSTEDGRHFIVMPFYAGKTLQKHIADSPLEVATALDIARQTAAGLAHARENGVVHRDVKPANLMITEAGEVKIVDFGLARLRGARNLTRTGSSLGTAAYMAPEQIHGAEVEHGADLWALGVVLHEMLLGQTPFRGESEPALLYAIVHLEPDPWSDRVPACVAPVLTRCLEKNPARRYATAEEVIADLDEALRIVTPAPAAAFGSEPRKTFTISRRSLTSAG